MKKALRLIVVVAILGALSVSAFAQKNGISFGPVKEYDQRTLFERFQRIQEAVLNMGPLFDKTALTKAIGAVQGASASATLSQLGINLSLPVASFANTNTSENKNSSQTSSDGTKTTTTTGSDQSSDDKKSSTLEQKAVEKPTLTKPDVSNGLTNPTQTFGIGASDLLAEQTQLTFQLVNMSLLLDRAVSDRVHLSPTSAQPSAETARTFVLGLDISIVPKYKDAVAEVVIEAQVQRDKATDPIAVATLLPYEKTYNTSSYTSSTSGFSLGTVFQVVGLSASNQSQNSKFYIARDLDTIGLHFDSDRNNMINPTTRFGWQFRPCLNRRAVEAGTRQMFAVLTLPDWQGLKKDSKPLAIKLTAKTRWLKYDRSKNLVDEKAFASDSTDLGTVQAYPASVVAASLAPKIFGNTVDITDAGGGNLLVKAEGENLFPGTTVSIGQVVKAPPESFVVSGQSEIRFLASINDFLTKRAEVIGPYGTAQTFDNTSPSTSLQLQATAPTIKQIDNQTALVTLHVKPIGPDGSPKELLGAPGMLRAMQTTRLAEGSQTTAVPLVVVFGAQAYGLSDHPVQVSSSLTGYDLTFVAPLSSVRGQSEYKIIPIIHNKQQPFRFDMHPDPALFIDSFSAAQSGDSAYFTIRGPGMDTTDMKLLVNGTELTVMYPAAPEPAAQVVIFKGPAALLDGFKNAILIRKGLVPLELSVAEPPKVQTTITSIGDADSRNSVPITVKGTALDKVKSVAISGGGADSAVDWYLDTKTKEYKIVLSLKQMELKDGQSEAKITLAFTVDGGAPIRAAITIKKSPQPAGG